MAETKSGELMEKIVSLCKRRGFIFQSSEIYGGLNGFWDYGPLGADLKRNVKEYWWNTMTRWRDDIAGLEAELPEWSQRAPLFGRWIQLKWRDGAGTVSVN